LPELDRFYREHNTEVGVLGVALNDTAEAIGQVLVSGGVTLPVMLDPGTMGMDYDISVIPTLFVLNSAGTVVKRITGVVQADDLTAILDDLAGR
jgi:hypothetical protein